MLKKSSLYSFHKKLGQKETPRNTVTINIATHKKDHRGRCTNTQGHTYPSIQSQPKYSTGYTQGNKTTYPYSGRQPGNRAFNRGRRNGQNSGYKGRPQCQVCEKTKPTALDCCTSLTKISSPQTLQLNPYQLRWQIFTLPLILTSTLTRVPQMTSPQKQIFS